LPALSLETPLYRLIIFGLVIGVVILCITFFVRVRERGFISVWQALSSKFPSETYNVIGGLLYLWLLTLSIVVFKILAGLVAVLPPFSRDVWALANDPFASGYHPLMRPLLLLDLAGRTALLCGATVVAEYFFKKHKFTPRLIVGFLLAYALLVLTEQLILMDLTRFSLAGFQPFAGSWPLLRIIFPGKVTESFLVLVSCLIWIPYFLLSKRVKRTFIR